MFTVSNILSQNLVVGSSVSAYNNAVTTNNKVNNKIHPIPASTPPGSWIGSIPSSLPDTGEIYELITDWSARLLPIRVNKRIGSQHGWVLMDNAYYHGYQQGYNVLNFPTALSSSASVTASPTGIISSANGNIHINNNNPMYIEGTMWTGSNGVTTSQANILVPIGTMVHLESIVLRNKVIKTSRVKLKMSIDGRNYKAIVSLDSFNEIQAIRHMQPIP